MILLNQIFYNCNKFDNASQLDRLNTYMLTTENYKNIIESLQKKPEHSAISSLEIKPIIEDNSVSSEVIQNEPLSISIKDVNTHTDTRNSALFYPQKENALF
jgi:hypothetical protein